MSLPLMAQYYSYVATDYYFITNVDSTIVRNDNDTNAIGYIVDNNDRLFYELNTDGFLNTGATPMSGGHKVPVLNGWSISDIRILGERVYFCGNDGSYGLFGYFDKNDLYNGVSVLYKYMRLNYFEKITTMNVYYDQAGDVRVAAAGETYINGVVAKSYIIEISNIQTGAYRFAMLPTSSPGRVETVQDIHKVGDILYFTGMEGSLTQETPFIRKTSAYNIFSSSIDDLFLYHNSSPSFDVIPQQLTTSTIVDDEMIALAHECINLSAGVFPTEIDVNFIDINTMQVGSTHRHYTGDRVQLHDMVYIPDEHLVVLNYSNASPSCFLQLQPYTTPPYLTFMHETYPDKYSSMDNLGTNSFMSAGMNHWYLQKLTGTIFLCYEFDKYKISEGQYYMERVYSPLENYLATAIINADESYRSQTFPLVICPNKLDE